MWHSISLINIHKAVTSQTILTMKSCFSSDDISYFRDNISNLDNDNDDDKLRYCNGYQFNLATSLNLDLICQFNHDKRITNQRNGKETKLINTNGFKSLKLIENCKMLMNKNKDAKSTHPAGEYIPKPQQVNSDQSRYLPPLQRKLKDKENLIKQKDNLRNKKTKLVREIKAIEEAFDTDILSMYREKGDALKSIKNQVVEASDRIYNINQERDQLLDSIHRLEQRIGDMHEMMKLKEVKKRDCYLKLHQKGRQAYQFNKQTEILFGVEPVEGINSKYLEYAVNQVENYTEKLRQLKMEQHYQESRTKAQIDRNYIRYESSRRLFIYYLKSKSKEEGRFYLKTLMDILQFDEEKMLLLNKIKCVK